MTRRPCRPRTGLGVGEHAANTIGERLEWVAGASGWVGWGGLQVDSTTPTCVDVDDFLGCTRIATTPYGSCGGGGQVQHRVCSCHQLSPSQPRHSWRTTLLRGTAIPPLTRLAASQLARPPSCKALSSPHSAFVLAPSWVSLVALCADWTECTDAIITDFRPPPTPALHAHFFALGGSAGSALSVKEVQ